MRVFAQALAGRVTALGGSERSRSKLARAIKDSVASEPPEYRDFVEENLTEICSGVIASIAPRARDEKFQQLLFSAPSDRTGEPSPETNIGAAISQDGWSVPGRAVAPSRAISAASSAIDALSSNSPQGSGRSMQILTMVLAAGRSAGSSDKPSDGGSSFYNRSRRVIADALLVEAATQPDNSDAVAFLRRAEYLLQAATGDAPTGALPGIAFALRFTRAWGNFARTPLFYARAVRALLLGVEGTAETGMIGRLTKETASEGRATDVRSARMALTLQALSEAKASAEFRGSGAVADACDLAWAEAQTAPASASWMKSAPKTLAGLAETKATLLESFLEGASPRDNGGGGADSGDEGGAGADQSGKAIEDPLGFYIDKKGDTPVPNDASAGAEDDGNNQDTKGGSREEASRKRVMQWLDNSAGDGDAGDVADEAVDQGAGNSGAAQTSAPTRSTRKRKKKTPTLRRSSRRRRRASSAGGSA